MERNSDHCTCTIRRWPGFTVEVTVGSLTFYSCTTAAGLALVLSQV